MSFVIFLWEQIKKLKNEVAQLKSSSSGTGEALANQDHKDIVRKAIINTTCIQCADPDCSYFQLITLPVLVITSCLR